MTGAELAPPARGLRHRWDELPGPLRAEVAARLGAGVARANSVPTGFSPGVAATLTLQDGRRVFAKAVANGWNRDTMALHRHEAEITAALPPSIPAARLLLSISQPDWTVLVLEHVAGRLPRLPWRRRELALVLAAVEGLSNLLTPSPVGTARASELVGFADGFKRLRQRREAVGDPLEDVDPWAVRNLERLEALEAGWSSSARGDTLCHFDLRQDNILIQSSRVVFVDWARAMVGPRWLDLACLLPSVAAQGGPEPWTIFSSHPLGRAVSERVLAPGVAAMAGYFLLRQTLPPPPGMPTVRAFQRAQGAPTLAWLRHLCDWP
ncbi:MAG: phosphotransferase [Candidatus Dormibacteria bacterium]